MIEIECPECKDPGPHTVYVDRDEEADVLCDHCTHRFTVQLELR